MPDVLRNIRKDMRKMYKKYRRAAQANGYAEQECIVTIKQMMASGKKWYPNA